MRLLTLSLLAALPALACVLAPMPGLTHEFAAGDIEVGHPFSLATPASTAAGYLTVTNHGTEPDALLAVEAPFPGVSLHRTEISDDGVASMPHVERFEIAPGATLTLEPGTAHIMFEGLDGDPLEAGEMIPATLIFEKAGRLDVEFKIEPLSYLREGADAAPMDHGTMDHGAMDHEAAASAHLVLGDLTLSGAFSRATLPNAPVAAGFVTIVNAGPQDDRLLSATSDVAGATQIHEMANVDDVMRMRPLPDGVPVPAGATVSLAPGGTHLMFMDLRQPLVEGEMVDVTLTFETAGTIIVPLAVGAPDAEESAYGEHE